MNLRSAPKLLLACVFVAAALAAGNDGGKPITVKGYVLDSACAFTKDLKKPINAQCATACAKAGSPLVILTDNGTIYWPLPTPLRQEGKTKSYCRSRDRKSRPTGGSFNGEVRAHWSLRRLNSYRIRSRSTLGSVVFAFTSTVTETSPAICLSPELMRQAYINPVARSLNDPADFSRHIRLNRPGFDFSGPQ